MSILMLQFDRPRCEGVCPSHRAFSLLELLVVIGILSLLTALSAPSVRSFMKSQAHDRAVAELLGSFELARSYALLNNTPVYVLFPADSAPSNGSESPTFRSWATAHETPEGDILPLTSWQTLPDSLSFGSEPRSVLGSDEDNAIPNIKLFPDWRHRKGMTGTGRENVPKVLMRYVLFDENGMIEVPASENQLVLFLCANPSATSLQTTADPSHSHPPTAKRVCEEIRLSQFTGQTQRLRAENSDL
jgi:prepilin-type N-terminal cleavage/methylation domain-containing protein